ncbi:hypothetical protein AB0764_07385 [Priestia megaterium]|uniref:hypothetical protein n=1 Tax=Priestia megaterium TaxID=1404 RepID=UPI0015FD87C6
MQISSGTYYKLLYPSHGNKGIWFEPYLDWDYMRIVDDPGTGVSVRFLETSPGRYKIQTASANWGDYNFFKGMGNGVKLTNEADACEWAIESRANGQVAIRHVVSNNYIVVGPLFNSKHWLELYNSALTQQEWQLQHA